MENKKLLLASCKQIQIYDLLNKIQNVLNTESLIPQFIYFAKNMEEMRKKWLESELKCKELEQKLNTEKSIYQRRINELKVDIEIHHEKRLQAENRSERLQNDLDKLQKQFELFREILTSDKNLASNANLFTNFNEFYDEFKKSSNTNLNQLNVLSNNTNTNKIKETNQAESKQVRRQSLCGIEDTGSIISDYTEDDIDLNNEEEEQQQPNTNNNNNNENKEPIKRVQRHSTSLTRHDENTSRKRTRSKSNDVKSKKRPSLNNAITAITTLQINDDGRPVKLTSEIKHNPEAIYMPQRARFRKKRPSREFLHTSIDELESNIDTSDLFWNNSDLIIEETSPDQAVNNNNNNNQNLHIMTPIKEISTPSTSNRIYSSARKQVNATPNTMTPFKTSSNLIPLAKRYKKSHLFKAQVILNSELCACCDKRTKFGKMIMKCRECDMIVHTECKDLIQRPCYRVLNYPANGAISDYVGADEYPHIPPILQMIINEIEFRGLLKHEVGLYRVNGSDTQIKQLKEKLIKRHQMPDLRKINDVHVLCSFVKDFLNNLTEHLVTYDSWYRFSKACEIQNEIDRQLALKEAVQDLPEANRDTLAFLILHLQRISDTVECKMPASNLARVFGPSIVGNSSAQLQPAEIINEIKIQHQIVENLIKIPTSFYMKFIEVNEHEQERLFKTLAKTPDLMKKSKTAVVLSSILGPAVNLQSSKI